MNKFVKDHILLIELLGPVLAGAIAITVYAHTTFASKEDVKSAIAGHVTADANIIMMNEKRLDRIEAKQDLILEKINRR